MRKSSHRRSWEVIWQTTVWWSALGCEKYPYGVKYLVYYLKISFSALNILQSVL